MDLCDYSSHHIEGISQVLPKSTSNSKKTFQRLFNTVHPSDSSSNEGEEIVNSNTTHFQTSFKTSGTNVTRLKSAAIPNQTNILQNNYRFLNQQKREPVLKSLSV